MKITICQLKRLIAEVTGTRARLDHMISHMDPDTIADDDYYDSETGEVYLEKGQQARTSELHPQFAKDHAKFSSLQRQLDADEEAEREREDRLDKSHQASKINDASAEFSDASREFAESSKSYVRDNPGADLEGVSSDMAENFFHVYPQWRDWARAMKMSRADLKDMVASDVYEAMTS